MYFEQGSVIEYSAWYYLDNDLDQPYLFLVDFEDSVAVGAGPGLRIAFDGDGRALEVERGKYGASTIHQPEKRINFPRRQWVHLVLIESIYLKVTRAPSNFGRMVNSSSYCRYLNDAPRYPVLHPGE